MKKRYLLFLILPLILLLFVPTFAAQAELSATVTDSSGTTIHIYPEENTLFLPAACDPSHVTIIWNGTEFPVDLTTAPASTDKEGAIFYEISFANSAGRSQTVRIYRDESLPSFFISTSKGLSFIESSKSNRDKNAEFLLLDADGTTAYSDNGSGTTSEIKGRGNATWGYLKKGYQVKLGAKTALFGMEKAKTWILIPNYVDQSQMHNALAFQMGNDLKLPCNIDYRYVNLYIDGSYRGLYMLTEKVQIDPARVAIHELEKDNEKANPNIALDTLPKRTVTNGTLISSSILTSYTYFEGMTNPKDISGGYLVELDNIWGSSEPSRFTTQNGNTYVVKSPEYVSREEMEYIASLFADMEEAIYSADGYNSMGKHFSEYIDLDSFAGVYAVQEMMKNWDAYLSSVFFHKDADQNGETAKIYAGPLWDFDNTLGNLNFETYATDRGFLWAQNGKFQSYVRALAAPMMKHADYAALVSEKIDFLYTKVQGYLAEGGFIDANYQKILSSVMMDRVRFHIAEPSRWVLGSGGNYKVSTKFMHFTRYGDPFDTENNTAMGYLRSFLADRAEALLQSIGSGVVPPPPEETTTAETTTTPEETTTAIVAPETTTQASETSAAPETTENTEPPMPQKSFPMAVVVVAALVVLGFLGFFLVKKKKT